MAALDKNLKQRIVGALVLVALAVIFLPMLFSRPDDQRQVVVDAPPIPQTPACNRQCREAPGKVACRMRIMPNIQQQHEVLAPKRHGATFETPAEEGIA